MKKVAALPLALVLICTAYAMSGCASRQPVVDSDAQTEEGVRVPTDEAPGGGTITGGAWDDLASRRGKLRSYEASMKMEGQDIKTAVKLDNSKPLKMRAETGQGIFLMDMGANVAYMYDPQANKAMKMPLPKPEQMEGFNPANMEKWEKDKPELISDTLDGKPVWRMDTDDSKVWLEKEYGLPVQIQAEGKTTRLTYDRINKVPDSEFELPKGAKVEDMSDIMKNIPQGAPGGMPRAVPRPDSGN